MTIYCSFCGIHKDYAKHLVSNPGKTVFMCNECVALAVQVLLIPKTENDSMIKRLDSWRKQNDRRN